MRETELYHPVCSKCCAATKSIFLTLPLNASLLAGACSSSTITNQFREHFITAWKESINSSSKLVFYKQVKDTFQWEHYLDICNKFNIRQSTAQIRCSAHKLAIETGRHNKTARDDRTCPYCLNNDGLSILDDENHLLQQCNLGQHQRETCSKDLADFPDFNIGATYPRPGNLNCSSSHILDSVIPAIKIACKTVHGLYQSKQKYMKDLKTQEKAVDPG